MAVNRDLDATLSLLTETLDQPHIDLGRAFDDFIAAVEQTVASCSGVTVTLNGPTGPVRMSSGSALSDTRPVRSSLWIRLDSGRSPDDEVEMVLYGANPGAFVDLAADLAWLLGRPLEEVMLDRHLEPLASSIRSVIDRSLMDQAVGVLIAGGWAPQEAQVELTQRAHELGVARWEAAQALLAGLDTERPDP